MSLIKPYFKFNYVKDTFLLKRRVKCHLQIFAYSCVNRVQNLKLAFKMSQYQFSSLTLKPLLLSNVESLGFESMTAIQAKSLPLILDGKDVIAQGQTGSGKTAAFGLGLLNKLDTKSFHVQSLVLCPTRELADQVSVEIRRLARTTPNVKVLTLFGGTPLKAQAASLEKAYILWLELRGELKICLISNY